jgi:hypothetical protein
MRAVVPAVMVSVALLATSGHSQVPDSRLVVPGQRIGAWTLQMTVDNLVAVLGRQTRIASGGQLGGDMQIDLRVYRWDNIGLLVYTRDGQSVLLMEVNQAPEFVTEKGITFDTPRAEVEAAYGRPTKVSQFGANPNNLSFQYDSLGLEVFFSGAARVQGLGIFRPGSASSVWKP